MHRLSRLVVTVGLSAGLLVTFGATPGNAVTLREALALNAKSNACTQGPVETNVDGTHTVNFLCGEPPNQVLIDCTEGRRCVVLAPPPKTSKNPSAAITAPRVTTIKVEDVPAKLANGSLVRTTVTEAVLLAMFKPSTSTTLKTGKTGK